MSQNNFFVDVNQLTDFQTIEAVDEDTIKIIEPKTNIGLKNKWLKRILLLEKRINELTEIVKEFKNEFEDPPVQKEQVPKTTIVQRKIDLSNIYSKFVDEHLSMLKNIDIFPKQVEEQFIKSTLKQNYFVNSILNMESLGGAIEKVLNIPDYDLKILKEAFALKKFNVLPTTKDIPTFVKFLELKPQTITYNNKELNLSSPHTIITDPELFETEKIKQETKYKINPDFQKELKNYGINISLNKFTKDKTIKDSFNKYLNNTKKIFIKISIEYEKYINIINEGNEDNYIIINNIIYMNKNKFDEVLKNAKIDNNFKPSIREEMENKGCNVITLQEFKNKIENSYK